MPKRDTVRPNMNSLAAKVSAKSWSEASFSQMVGKHKRWISEVRRGKNLPSPEEAARMCVLLQTTPEEILVEKADIDLVSAMLENEAAKEKAPGPQAESDLERRLRDIAAKLPPDFLEREIAYLEQKAQQLHVPADSDM